MNTEQILIRQLFNSEIRQKHKTQAFNATDLVLAGNKFRISQGLKPFDLSYFLGLTQTKEFIAEIELKYGWAKYAARGKAGGTWVHPLLFLDIALAIHPALKLETYEWMMDELCKVRDESGDSFKKMCGVLYVRSTNKREFPDYIKNVCQRIKVTCQVEEWNSADQRQLKMRDAIHEDIAWLSEELRSTDKAVEMALTRARKLNK